MKATFTQTVTVKNPAYSREDHKAAMKAGQPYDVDQVLTMEPGFTVDDPDAWIHCCPGVLNASPRAEAADDECRARVKDFMERERPARLRQVQTLLDNVDKLKDDKQKRHVMKLAKAYGLKPGTDPASDDTPKKTTKKDS